MASPTEKPPTVKPQYMHTVQDLDPEQSILSHKSASDSSIVSSSDSQATSVDDLSQDKNPDTKNSVIDGENEQAEDLNAKDSALKQEKRSKHRRSKIQFNDPEESSSDESSASDDYYDTRRASRLSSTGLYQSYLEKLKLQAESSSKKRNHGSNMIKGFINYVRVLEDRISNLESGKSSQDDEKTSPTEEEIPKSKPTGTEEVPLDKAESLETEAEARKWADVGLDVKFFSAETEINEAGDSIYRGDGPKGTFTCSEDQRNLIRAIYDWREDLIQTPPRLLDGDQPSPDQIDLLMIAIDSVPIISFFKKKLNLDPSDSSLMRISKPFRPLLRNMKTLKDYLAELEKKYGSEDTTHPSTDIDLDSGEGVHDSGPYSQPQDDLPFPPSSQEEEKDPFDCQEAIEHFRVLLQFTSKYFSKRINLLAEAKLGNAEKISFENLWMLFGTGDTICCPRREGGLTLKNGDDEQHVTKRRDVPQGYQVLSTVGGCPQRAGFARRTKQMMMDAMNQAPISRSLRKQLLKGQRSIASKHRYFPLYVYCFYIDFDGIKYGTVTDIFVFKPYEGEVDIQSLEAFPVDYLHGSNQGEPASDYLLQRGKKFIDMTTVSHMTYEGLTIGETREEISSTVMIDFRLAYTEYMQSFKDPESVPPVFSSLSGFWYDTKYSQMQELRPPAAQSSCSCSSCSDRWVSEQKGQREKMETKIKSILEDYEFEKSNQVSDLEHFKHYMEDNDLIKLLPGVVPGFALRNRRWIQVDLGLLKYVTQESSWDKLVLPDGHKEMVQAMVETHAKGANSTASLAQERVEMDLVRGKGKGCIILLHGAPGVGKTSTAECVAAHTKKPLYPITCGDIGYLPSEVEKNMENHFKLAHKWGCVLLLDEADVFLAKRSKEDVKRNGLVSVFLRILEYYSGILFLTTNRVGAIDDAFRSRLHLTLYYPKLTRKQTIKIWKTNLDHVREINQEREKNNQLAIIYKHEKIVKWVKKNWEDLHWNGRQIRNAFQTAIALAEFKALPSASTNKPQAPVMNVHWFEVIATASIQFNHYLTTTHGLDEEKIAKRDMIRSEADLFKVSFKKTDSTDDSDDSSEDSDENSNHDSDEKKSDEDSDDSRKDKKKKKKKTGSPSKAKGSKGEKLKDRKKK